MTDFFKGIPKIAYEGKDSTSDFAFRHYNGRIVGITGTNGKTTTTELVQRITVIDTIAP